MKKSIKMLMVLAASIITLAACNKEEKDITVQGEKETFTVNFTASSDELTKVYFGDKTDEGKYPVYWNGGERVAVIAIPVDADNNFIVEGIQAFMGENAPVAEAINDGRNASFSINVEKNEDAASWIFSARCPTETFFTYGVAESGRPFLTYAIPTVQTPLSSSPDPSAMYLSSFSTAQEADGVVNVDFKFRHGMVNYLKMSLKNLDESANITEVRLAFAPIESDTGDKAFGDFRYEFDYILEELRASGDITGGVNEATIKTSNRDDIWVVLNVGCEIRNRDLTVTVVTDKGNYTKTINFGSYNLSSLGGQVGSFGINFAGIEPKLKGYNLVTDLSEVTNGDYVIVGIGSDSKYYAIPTGGVESNGVVDGVEVNVVNEVVSEADAAGKVWSLTRTGDVCTLFDGSKYLYPKDAGHNDLAYGNGTDNNWIISEKADGKFIFTSNVAGSPANYAIMIVRSNGNFKAYSKTNLNNSAYDCVYLYKSGIVLTPRNLAWDSITEEAVVGDNFTVTVTGDYSDGITFSSSNPAVATIDENTGEVTAIKAGSTTITASAGKTEEYAAESISYDLIVSSDDIFYESFDKCNGTGGNDNQWSGSIASSGLGDSNCDNAGWTFASGSSADECAKFGTRTAKGSAETPEISLAAGIYTLTFKAGAWDGSSEGTTLNISATGCNLSASSVTLVKGAFSDYSLVITCTSAADVKIKFEAANASNNRFFLDEVKIVAGGEAPEFLNVSSETVSVACDATTATFDIESNVAWTITANPEVTVTPTSGNGNETITVSGIDPNTSASERTISTLTITGGDDLTKTVVIKQEGNPDAIEDVTIAQFLAKEIGSNLYRISGTIDNIANATYGNLTLTDGSGSVYVYGVKKDKDAGNQTFSELDLVDGDGLTIVCQRGEHNGTPEALNAYQVAMVHQPRMSVSPETVEFGASGGSKDITVNCKYFDGATISAASSNAAFSTSVSGTTVTVTADANTASSELSGTITITATNGSTTKTGEVSVSQEAAANEPTGINGYVRVDDVAWLHSGDKVVIAADGYDFAMSTTQNTNNRGQATVKKGTSGSFATLTAGEGVQEFTLVAGNKANTWAFQTSNGYIYAANSSSNYLKTEINLSDNSSWIVSISSGISTITAQGTNTHNVLQYNQSSSCFSCYGSASQKAVSIYKWYGEIPQPSKLATPSPSFSDNAVSWAAIADAQGYKVKVGDGEEVSVSGTTYSLASLDAGTYSVTVKAVGNGTTTIDSDWSAAITCTVTGGGTEDKTFTITSDEIVSNSSYAKYDGTVDNRSWIITYGGNNKSVGTNSGNRSKCTLSNYSKYAVSPVTTSNTASAFASTTKIDNVKAIEYSFNGGSNQTNTNVYLIYSSDGNTFSQISLSNGTQGATISSGTKFEFAKCSGYFAVVFKATNSSGNWRIDDVNLTFTYEGN